MDFTLPSQEGYTIYSKSGCPNCTKTKKLLEGDTPAPVIIDCDDYLIEDKEGFLKFIEATAKKEWKTFPMIFYNGQFIGGYQETMSHYECKKTFIEVSDF